MFCAPPSAHPLSSLRSRWLLYLLTLFLAFCRPFPALSLASFLSFFRSLSLCFSLVLSFSSSFLFFSFLVSLSPFLSFFLSCSLFLFLFLPFAILLSFFFLLSLLSLFLFLFFSLFFYLSFVLLFFFTFFLSFSPCFVFSYLLLDGIALAEQQTYIIMGLLEERRRTVRFHLHGGDSVHNCSG